MKTLGRRALTSRLPAAPRRPQSPPHTPADNPLSSAPRSTPLRSVRGPRLPAASVLRDRATADLEGHIRVSALAIRLGHLQADGDVVGIGRQLFAQHPQLVIAVAGVDGIVNLPVPHALRSGGGRGLGDLGVLDAGHHRERQRRQPESSCHALVNRQLVAGLGAALFHRAGRKLEHGMSQQAGGEPPRAHRAPGLPNLVAFVQVHQIDRKLHEKRMDGFARDDPQALAWLQPFVL